MVDIDSALLSVQERDNWRRRMDVLEHTLAEVREQRERLRIRLRRVRKELSRLRARADAIFDLSRPTQPPEMTRVPSPSALRNR
ncbi:MAG: hypothetical protein ACRECT_02480 [Thermoplasmata archaeon]